MIVLMDRFNLAVHVKLFFIKRVSCLQFIIFYKLQLWFLAPKLANPKMADSKSPKSTTKIIKKISPEMTSEFVSIIDLVTEKRHF